MMGVLVTVKDLPPPLKYAHPLCVWKKMLELGLDRKEAARRCLGEGKVQGIPKLFGTIVKVDGYALRAREPERERLRLAREMLREAEVERELWRAGIVPREEAIRRLRELYEKAESPSARERIWEELVSLEQSPEATITVEKLRELEQLALLPPKRRSVKEYPPVPWIRLRRVFKIDHEWEGDYEIEAGGRISIHYRGLKGVDSLGLTVEQLRSLPKERILDFMVENGIPRDLAERMYRLMIRDVNEVYPPGVEVV